MIKLSELRGGQAYALDSYRHFNRIVAARFPGLAYRRRDSYFAGNRSDRPHR